MNANTASARPKTLRSVRASIRAGVLSGLLGGALMAIVLFRLSLAGTPAAWQPLRGIAASLLGEEALGGGPFAMLLALAVHVATSCAWGIAFASATGGRPRGLTAFVLGVAAAMLVMVVMTFGVLPTIDPILYDQALRALPAWIAAHAAFGVGLATAPYVQRRTRDFAALPTPAEAP